MSIQLEVSESQERIGDFDVTTVLGMRNTSNLGPIQHSEEFLGHDSGLTNRILSSASSGLLTPTHACGSNSSLGVTGNWADRRILEKRTEWVRAGSSSHKMDVST